ncbi:MAG TPA: hypothetical protein VHS31_10705 [Tepidisphaeraceae bacterium]|jgi:hypothetical protein|nr:hypothetical protein [Tepidisphaeraceae bacterium]
MRRTLLVLVTSALLLPFAAQSSAAPDDDAVAQYRAYVTAVRAGKPEEVMKLIEPVPETSKPLLTACIAQEIAVEAMKKEMVAQMGPAKTGDDAWAIGGLPYDDVLKNLKGVAGGADVVMILATKPEGTVGWVARRNGKWIVPAGLVMDLQPAAQFVEPEAPAREESIKYANATAKAADTVLQRLKKKEFKQPADVLKAFSDEMQAATKR